MLPSVEASIRETFEIRAELGRGTFSKVYRAAVRVQSRGGAELARHLPFPMPTTVALKVVDFSLWEAYQKGQRDLAETILATELEVLGVVASRPELREHPNVVKVFAAVREPSRVAIVMEELRGGELFDRILQRGFFTEIDAARTILEAATALLEIHRAGILHRDVKPENLVFLDSSASSPLRVTDFGLSCLKGSRDPFNEYGLLVGTIGYVAPEVVAARSYAEACDVWSLGVLTYVLLCGYMPFSGKSSSAIIQRTLASKYEFHDARWANVSPGAKALVARMLALDAGSRATIDDVIRDPWVTRCGGPQPVFASATTASATELTHYIEMHKNRAAAHALIAGSRFGIKRRLADLVERHLGAVSLESLHRILASFRAAPPQQVLLGEGRTDLYALLSAFQREPLRALPLIEIFRLFDRTGSGSVSYIALLAHLASLGAPTPESVAFCFRAYDADDDGKLTRDQVVNLLRNLLAGRGRAVNGFLGGSILGSMAAPTATVPMNSNELVLSDADFVLESSIEFLLSAVGPEGVVLGELCHRFWTDPELAAALSAPIEHSAGAEEDHGVPPRPNGARTLGDDGRTTAPA